MRPGGGDVRARRLSHLLPLVLSALNNEKRRAILAVLLEAEDKVPFSELKRRFRVESASLAHHLNKLQQAALVERTVELASPRSAKDPYYCYYRATAFARAFVPRVYEAVEDSAALVTQ